MASEDREEHGAEKEEEAYADYILEGGKPQDTATSVPTIRREDLRDTRRLDVDEMRQIAEDE